MSSEYLAPLNVLDEAFLVASLIERCPKTMMLRELVVNAVEAASQTASGPSIVSISSTTVNGTPKLRIWNTGPGLSASELDRICDIASSLRKTVGLNSNFGMGAKVASLPSNHRGMIYRSCKEGRVSQVIIGRHDGVYGRLLQPNANGGPLLRVIDVTDQCREDRPLDFDWTEVVLMGNHDDQNTLLDPYAGSPEVPTEWVATYLDERFFRLPSEVQLELLPGNVGLPAIHFRPASMRFHEFTRTESVITSSGNTVHYCYLEGVNGGEDVSGPAKNFRGIGAIVYKGEIYGRLTTRQWAVEAPAFGISFGARAISIFVELSDEALVSPEAYRQFLRIAYGDQHQITLADYVHEVCKSIPDWLRLIIAADSPQQADYLSEVRDELEGLIAELGLEPDEKPSERRPSTPAAENLQAVTQPPQRRYQSAPEVLVLRDIGQIDERGLSGRVAYFVPETKQIFINSKYPGINRMVLHLEYCFAEVPNQERVATLAVEIAEWSIIRSVARTIVFSMTKLKEGWTKEEIARSRSAESLTVLADNYQSSLGAALQRFSSMLSESRNLTTFAGGLDGAESARLRDRQRQQSELEAVEQAARRGLAAGTSPAGPFMRRLSEVAGRRNNFTLALEWARRAVEADTSDPWSQFQLSGVLLSTGDMDGARQATTRALELSQPNPHAALLRRMGEVEARVGDKLRALDWARKAVAADSSDAWSHHNLSGSLLAVNEIDEAEKEAHLAINCSITAVHSAFYSRLGEIYSRRGDRAAAIDWTKRAVERNAADVWAQFSLAGLLISAGRLEEAADAARSAATMSGHSVPSAFARRVSEIEVLRHNLPEALSWADRAVATAPTDVWANHQLSAVLQKTGDLSGAAEAAETAIASVGAPVPAALLQRMSEVRLEQGNIQAAGALARQAVHAAPQNPWINCHLARILLRIGDLSDALHAAETALEHATGASVSSFQRLLSEIFLARKEIDPALAWARKAVETDEGDAWNQSHLAGILLSTGDLDGAERAARLALISSSPTGVDHLTSVLRQVQVRREGVMPAMNKTAGR